MKAWHFLSADGMTRYEPRELVTVGQTLKVTPPIELCHRGLHASVRALDALQYAPGPICCRVELSGEIISDTDKVVATERTVLLMFDATDVLHEMACLSATSALLIADVKDKRCWAAIEAKRAWVRGEISDQELNAARDAAWDAARDAAWAAAWAAARDAAWDAARAAAWDAAWAAAWDAARAAARAAARDAARDAAWDEQNTVLEQLLTEAGGQP